MGETLIGTDSMLGGGRLFHFFVRRPEPDKQINEGLVRDIIEGEKLAFCTYDILISQT
jgi:hypothetical protein